MEEAVEADFSEVVSHEVDVGICFDLLELLKSLLELHAVERNGFGPAVDSNIEGHVGVLPEFLTHCLYVLKEKLSRLQ